MRIAIAGKGGSGKSVIAGTLARLFARAGRKVLVLDSDAMPGVGISLGLGARSDALLIDASERDEEGQWRLKKGISAARAVRRFALSGPDGVKLLQFGKLQGEHLSELAPSLHGFIHIARRLATSRALADWTIIADLPAGPRHVAFNWVPYARTALIVVEPDWKSVLTARRLARIVRQRGISEVAFVANKVSSQREARDVSQRLGERVLATVALDEAVAASDRIGLALIDHAPASKAVAAIADLAEKLQSNSIGEEVEGL